jgi:hypothetical protein
LGELVALVGLIAAGVLVAFPKVFAALLVLVVAQLNL